MKKWSLILSVAWAASWMTAAHLAFAAGASYDSGSTGADGAFNPTTSQSVQLPPDGVFNYTSVNIPSGVTITYIKNAANTPVTILASGDVTIAGTLSVSATQPSSSSDISGPGLGGPGGYDGGRGGLPGGNASSWVSGYGGPNVGRAGVGPGGGAPGTVHYPSGWYGSGWFDASVGGGGAYGAAPNGSGGYCPTTPGVVYGSATLLPLVGGSGGGGGAGGPNLPGSGGGGGGGAILIAASGTINVTGALLADGGSPVSPGATNIGRGAYGGAGSGGAIRLIATTVSGNGTISAAGGTSSTELWNNGSWGNYGVCSTQSNGSQHGGSGRIRIESGNLLRTTATNPSYVGGSPSLAFVPGLPTLRIDSIGGIAVPAQPTGSGDVALPASFTNPVTVTFATSGVTVGSTVKLTVIPAKGTATSVNSAPTTGTTNSATASASVSLQSGPNTLQASVTYTVVASVGDAMSIYAQGERVEKVTLTSTLGGGESQVTLTTLSGKEYKVPASALARLPS